MYPCDSYVLRKDYLCTCTVVYRPKHMGDTGKDYRSKQPKEMTIAVQMFSTMLPDELQGETEFHKASDENIQRDRSTGRGIKASNNDQEHA